jgi:hypothetical protein
MALDLLQTLYATQRSYENERDRTFEALGQKGPCV